MEKESYQEMPLKLAEILHALSHPARLTIMLHLAKYKGCRARSISDKLPLAKSTISEHLSKLKQAGLISCNPEGVCQNYQLNEEMFLLVKSHLFDFIHQIENKKDVKLKC